MLERAGRDKVLIVLHQDHSTPGRIGAMLAERGFALDIRRPSLGEPLPATLADHAGVVVFGGPMSANDEDEFIRREIDWISVPLKDNKPFLGICLGLQLLFTTSFEDGEYQGLDLLPGEVVRFPDVPGLKVPHMGWNQLHFRKPAPLFRDVCDGSSVYFVHSYYAVPRNQEVIAADTDYPEPFASIIWHENILATQFHPEKSQRAGLTMLRNFAEL